MEDKVMENFMANLTVARRKSKFGGPFVINAVRYMHEFNSVPLQRLYLEYMLKGMASSEDSRGLLMEYYDKFFGDNIYNLPEQDLKDIKLYVDRILYPQNNQ